jgi:MSHA biogenesis protein MshJ
MKGFLQTLIGRIDALSVRERIFMFASVVLCSAALFDAVWLSPAQTLHQQLTLRLGKQSVELERMRDLVKATIKADEVPAPIEQELRALQLKLEQTNQAVRELLPPAQGAPLVQALTHLLKRYPGLMLVKTSAVAPEVAGPGNAKSTGLPEGLTRQGLSVTVAGAYPDLTRFVGTLELEMPHVRWGAMNLKSEKGLPELTLHLFLLTEVVK